MPFQKKCPLCSAKMGKVNGVLTCPDCGYNESFGRSSYTTTSTGTTADTGESSRARYQSSNTGQGSTASGAASAQNLRPYEQYLNQQQYNASTPSFAEMTAQRRERYGDERPKSNSKILIICAALLIVFLTILIPLVMRFFTASANRYHTASKEDTDNRRAGGYTADDNAYDDTQPIQETAAITVPQSEFFAQMMCFIFEKDSSALTADDSEQLVSLRIYEAGYDYMAVDYVLSDGTGGTVYPASQKCDMSEDLTCFVNLEELYLEEAFYGNLNLDGLDKLHTLYYDGYISDIENAVNPSQLTELGLYDVKFSISDLSAFTNVERLYIDCGMLSDVSGILDLPNLKHLTIEDGDYIDDLSALYQATQLESLSIESNSLRDVSFLTKFDNLKELTIVGSKVLDFNPLAACTGLEKLYLLKNYETADYEFVKGLTGLREFGLMTSFDFDDSDMPDLSALSNVTKLYLGNFESFGNLKYMTNVEELTIDDGGYGDFGSTNALLSLPNLRSLSVINSSVSPEMIQQISEAEGLEYLDFYSSYLWSGIHPIINMPNLEELHLDYTSFMIDPDSIAANERLRLLDMNNSQIYKYSTDQWSDREDIDVEALQSALANLHGMEELMLEDLTINSVEFAAQMKNLKLLNITDNYVTSLAPLKELEKLQAVVCESNPISDTAGLDAIMIK